MDSQTANFGVFFTGFDHELMQAWRSTGGLAMKEFTNKIFYDQSAKDVDFVQASWPDGWTATISGVTVAVWKAKEATTATKSTSGEIFWANADGSLQ
eukprot:3543052-Heterocapsa_arctica.AAC.1